VREDRTSERWSAALLALAASAGAQVTTFGADLGLSNNVAFDCSVWPVARGARPDAPGVPIPAFDTGDHRSGAYDLPGLAAERFDPACRPVSALSYPAPSFRMLRPVAPQAHRKAAEPYRMCYTVTSLRDIT